MADRKSSSEAFPARKGDPSARYTYTDREGSARELRADAEGVVRPHDRDGERILEGFGLRIVKEEAKAAAGGGASRKASAADGPLKVESTKPGDDAGDAEGTA